MSLRDAMTICGSDSFSKVVTAAADAIRCDEAFQNQLTDLLIECGHIRDVSDDVTVVKSILDRFAAVLRDVTAAILPDVVVDARSRHAQIRCVLVDEPQQTYGIDDLAQLWQITPDEVIDICHDELMRADTGRVPWADVIRASITFVLFRPTDIEEILAGRLDGLPVEKWQTVPVLVHLPRFVVDALSDWPFACNPRILAAQVERFILEHFLAEYPRVSEAL